MLSHIALLCIRYTCLTVGDAICVYYNNRKYFIDVVEAKPAPAISVIDTDCEVCCLQWSGSTLVFAPLAMHDLLLGSVQSAVSGCLACRSTLPSRLTM